MDKRFIKALLEEGRKISDIPQDEALIKLNNDIMTVYVMNGLHRGLQPEAFKEEVRTCAVAMYQELTSDPNYRTIRDKEIQYIFSNGMKGRLGSDKDIGLSYKNLIRWVEGYVHHPERKEALRMYAESRSPHVQKLPPREASEDDTIRMVNNAWQDWVEWKNHLDESLRGKATRNRKDSPSSLSDILRFPITCHDYGRIRINYLVRLGIAKDGDKLTDVFDTLWSDGFRDKLLIK